jgi:hypothetical protein
MAFEKNETAYKILRALRLWGGIHPLVSTDQPSVEASALNGQGRGYVVLANHSAATLKTLITTALPIHALKQLTVGGSIAVPRGKEGWSIDLPSYSGAILEWNH